MIGSALINCRLNVAIKNLMFNLDLDFPLKCSSIRCLGNSNDSPQKGPVSHIGVQQSEMVQIKKKNLMYTFSFHCRILQEKQL